MSGVTPKPPQRRRNVMEEKTEWEKTGYLTDIVKYISCIHFTIIFDCVNTLREGSYQGFGIISVMEGLWSSLPSRFILLWFTTSLWLPSSCSHGSSSKLSPYIQTPLESYFSKLSTSSIYSHIHIIFSFSLLLNSRAWILWQCKPPEKIIAWVW